MKSLVLLATFILGMFVALVMFVSAAFAAADLTITCSESACSSEPVGGPVFDEVNLLPTESVTRTVKARNTSSEALDFAVEVEDTGFDDSSPSLASILSVTISEQESSAVVYGPRTIEQWKADGFVLLSTVPQGAERNYNFTVVMANVGDEYEGKTLSFDLNLGFDALPQTSTGSILGASTASNASGGPAVCTSPSPTSSLVLSTAASGPNAVLLIWSSVTPVTHYTIVYGIVPENPIYGAVNVGNVTRYLVSGLSGGVTYYFRVAGVNDCAPGPWSNESSATPTGVVLGESPAEEFEEILGAATETQETEIPPIPGIFGSEGTGEVFGVEACATYLPWWLPLMLQLVLTLLYFATRKQRYSIRRTIRVPLLLALFSFIAHLILGCPCELSRWCQWFWLFDLMILFGTTILYRLTKKRLPEAYS